MQKIQNPSIVLNTSDLMQKAYHHLNEAVEYARHNMAKLALLERGKFNVYEDLYEELTGHKPHYDSARIFTLENRWASWSDGTDLDCAEIGKVDESPYLEITPEALKAMNKFWEDGEL